MKPNAFFLLLFLAFFTFSCADDEDSIAPAGIVGEWELVEFLADPGDGSGVFEPVDSDKRITFTEQNTFSATESMCSFNDDSASTGTYSLEDNTISTEDCATAGGSPIGLELVGEELIISYLCIEPCQEKYRRR